MKKASFRLAFNFNKRKSLTSPWEGLQDLQVEALKVYLIEIGRLVYRRSAGIASGETSAVMLSNEVQRT